MERQSPIGVRLAIMLGPGSGQASLRMKISSRVRKYLCRQDSCGEERQQ